MHTNTIANSKECILDSLLRAKMRHFILLLNALMIYESMKYAINWRVSNERNTALEQMNVPEVAT